MIFEILYFLLLGLFIGAMFGVLVYAIKGCNEMVNVANDCSNKGVVEDEEM